MNLIIVYREDFLDDNTVKIEGRRYNHIIEIHRAEVGKKLKVGLINGKMGEGEVLRIENDSVIISLSLTQDPPSPSNVEIIMAMPRPKVFKRIIQDLTSMGIKKINIIETWKVEKSFWHSPKLEENSLKEAIVLGLEQGKDTIMPEINFFRRFRPFIEDKIPDIIIGKRAILAHPLSDNNDIEIKADREKVVLAIGPEGGFTDYEVAMFKRYGFEDISLGERILRVETVLPYLIGKIS